MLQKTYEAFTVTIEDKVAHIQMNRPEAMNTMNKAFWNELPAIVRDIDMNVRARCIVISSTGKHFSAGMDVAVFGSGEGAGKVDRYVAAEAFRSNIRQIQSSFNVLEEARVPVLFALHGGVIGGAIDMISAGDIRWCTKDAFFTIMETNIAMTADVATAKDIGLVNDVFDTHEACVAHAMATAREIASKDPLTVTGCKTLINYARDHNTADTLDYIGVWNAAMLPPSHMQEAFAARAEKRDPDYPDLLKLRDTPM